MTAAKAEKNLRAKIIDPRFRADLDPLVTQIPDGYSIETAAELIIDELITHLD